jgi:hypothetical protein
MLRTLQARPFVAALRHQKHWVHYQLSNATAGAVTEGNVNIGCGRVFTGRYPQMLFCWLKKRRDAKKGRRGLESILLLVGNRDALR